MTTSWSMTLWTDDLTVFDHAGMGFARLLWQYRGDQPRVQAWLQAFTEQLQSIEDVAFEVLVGRWPLTAVGDQLDVLGRIVGQTRRGMLDAQYRLYVLARILLNRSNGRLEELYDILEVLGVTEVHAVEYYPGELTLWISGEEYGDLIGEIIGSAKPGGVTLHWIWSETPSANTFKFSSTLGADSVDADAGFGDLTEATQTTGGSWAGGAMY